MPSFYSLKLVLLAINSIEKEAKYANITNEEKDYEIDDTWKASLLKAISESQRIMPEIEELPTEPNKEEIIEADFEGLKNILYKNGNKKKGVENKSRNVENSEEERKRMKECGFKKKLFGEREKEKMQNIIERKQSLKGTTSSRSINPSTVDSRSLTLSESIQTVHVNKLTNLGHNPSSDREVSDSEGVQRGLIEEERSLHLSDLIVTRVNDGDEMECPTSTLVMDALAPVKMIALATQTIKNKRDELKEPDASINVSSAPTKVFEIESPVPGPHFAPSESASDQWSLSISEKYYGKQDILPPGSERVEPNEFPEFNKLDLSGNEQYRATGQLSCTEELSKSMQLPSPRTSVTGRLREEDLHIDESVRQETSERYDVDKPALFDRLPTTDYAENTSVLLEDNDSVVMQVSSECIDAYSVLKDPLTLSETMQAGHVDKII
ncbi:unnamed protein product, partial [Protopolystoma xenopodis]